MARVLLTQAIHPRVEARLAELAEVETAPDTSADTLRRCAQGCDVIVVRAQLPDDLFEAAPRLIGAVPTPARWPSMCCAACCSWPGTSRR